MPKKLLRKVRDFINTHDMLEPGDRVVVAVSGGPDSVCLLDILHELAPEYEITLIVAHFDHTLRPPEDQGETEFVQGLAHKYGYEFHTAKASPAIHSAKGSLEERAREQRYSFLEHVRRKTRANKIALGHQLDDQAETVLLRLLRGSGMQGLAGMRPVRDQVFIRPLLSVTREEILEYLGEKGLRWMEDSSNLSPNPMRNRIRLELLPLLKTYQPHVTEILARAADTLRLDNDFLEHFSAQWLEAHVVREEIGFLVLPIPPLLQLDPSVQRRVLRAAIKRYTGTLRRISLAHVSGVLEILKSPKPQSEQHLPNGMVIKKRYDRLILARKSARKQKPFQYHIEGPGSCCIDEINSCLEIQELTRAEAPPLHSSPWEAFFDAGKLSFPFTIRSYSPGDRMVPLGMKGRKKVHDLLVDNKVPLELRPMIPLIISKGEIAWVAGIRIGDSFKVTKLSRKILRLRLTGDIVRNFEVTQQ